MAEGYDTASAKGVSGSKTTRKDLQKMVFKPVKRIKLIVQMNLEVGDFATWPGAGGGFFYLRKWDSGTKSQLGCQQRLILDNIR